MTREPFFKGIAHILLDLFTNVLFLPPESSMTFAQQAIAGIFEGFEKAEILKKYEIFTGIPPTEGRGHIPYWFLIKLKFHSDPKFYYITYYKTNKVEIDREGQSLGNATSLETLYIYTLNNGIELKKEKLRQIKVTGK